MNGQDYISHRFLDALYARLRCSETPANFEAAGRHYFLRVRVPENPKGRDFDLSPAIVTYAPSMEEIVLHFGIETLQVALKDWVELQRDADGNLLYVKKDVAYQFVSKGI